MPDPGQGADLTARRSAPLPPRPVGAYCESGVMGRPRGALGVLAMTSAIRLLSLAALAVVGAAMCAGGSAAQQCGNRGQLDALYCDDNYDLVADAPTDPSRW